jgi:hypothetical protein
MAAWPNDADRISWEAYRASGVDLPPYDAAGDYMQMLWYGLQRLTDETIAAACQDILTRLK